MAIDLSRYRNIIDAANPVNYLGYVTQIVGLTIESKGPQVSIGEICTIKTEEKDIRAEVVGFKDSKVLLMPLGEMQGIGPGQPIFANGEILRVKEGHSL